jgi:hypothetical protein
VAGVIGPGGGWPSEPDTHPAAGPFKAALATNGISATSLAVGNVHAESSGCAT